MSYCFIVFFFWESMLWAKMKISVITDISVLGFYGYIGNINKYFDKNIGKTKINKNALKFIEIFC